ncbi:hypothetical protein Clacol_002977 [Clathrus columnatus]|uniref:C2H2-type domain-containing protein n=1 Tax=Clathrus columnatus TaxID=1419009 RepID=A0AAV5A7Y2_9AGAM|nr:hypothetical protein Clacol_002977 [Clathrus columnatus]
MAFYTFSEQLAANTTQRFDTYYEETKPVIHLELDMSTVQLVPDEPSPNLMQALQPPRPFASEQSFLPNFPSQNTLQLFEDCRPGSPNLWDCHFEQESFITLPTIHPFPSPASLDMGYSPETFSSSSPLHLPIHSLSHHSSFSSEHTYTRMFRGRKSKSAAEVLDELRPYACDICQAAFARSHDRDRHKRSHTGETPYRCHGCGMGFKRPDARKRHWERDPVCAQEDWLRVRHTPEGAKRRARAKSKTSKKQSD